MRVQNLQSYQKNYVVSIGSNKSSCPTIRTFWTACSTLSSKKIYTRQPRRRTSLQWSRKKGKDLSEAGGWRPIILGSVLARVFSGIIEARITKIITLSKRQMVFVDGNDIVANIFALDLAVKRGKTSHLSLAPSTFRKSSIVSLTRPSCGRCLN